MSVGPNGHTNARLRAAAAAFLSLAAGCDAFYDPLGRRESPVAPTGCRADSDCGGLHCDTLTGACLECLADTDCVEPPGGRCWNPTGACDPSTRTCTYTPRSNGAECDDSNKCTVTDACDGAGKCIGSGELTAGAVGPCQEASACDPFRGIVTLTRPNNASCGQNGEICVAGACKCGRASFETDCSDRVDNDCDGKIDCEDPDCATKPCNDRNACTSGETCRSGACSAATQTLTCEHRPNACFRELGSCDPGDAHCTYTPSDAGTGCDDGLRCTDDDGCDGAGSCSGKPRVCNTPPSECWKPLGACDEERGCTYEPAEKGTKCDDDNACSTGEECDGHGACLPVTAVPCVNDPGSCRVVSGCNPQTGACTYVPREKGAVCRPAAGECDVAEVCDGVNEGCPPQEFVESWKSCRAKAGGCDLEEFCTGIGPHCPVDAFEPSSHECTKALGPCDVTEFCPGDGPECPPDEFLGPTTPCRSADGLCDVAETCTGNGPACPDDKVKAKNTVCLAGDPSKPCDADDVCDGASKACAPLFQPSTKVCRAAAAPCDAAESCTGLSAECPANGFSPKGTCGCGLNVRKTCDGQGACISAPDELRGTGLGLCIDGVDNDCDGAIDCRLNALGLVTGDAGCFLTQIKCGTN